MSLKKLGEYMRVLRAGRVKRRGCGEGERGEDVGKGKERVGNYSFGNAGGKQ